MMTIYELPATPLVAVCSDEQDNLQYSLVVLNFFFIQKVYSYQSGCHCRKTATHAAESQRHCSLIFLQ